MRKQHGSKSNNNYFDDKYVGEWFRKKFLYLPIDLQTYILFLMPPMTRKKLFEGKALNSGKNILLGVKDREIFFKQMVETSEGILQEKTFQGTLLMFTEMELKCEKRGIIKKEYMPQIQAQWSRRNKPPGVGEEEDFFNRLEALPLMELSGIEVHLKKQKTLEEQHCRNEGRWWWRIARNKCDNFTFNLKNGFRLIAVVGYSVILMVFIDLAISGFDIDKAGKSAMGAIVSGVVFGLLLLLCACARVLYQKRRWSKNRSVKKLDGFSPLLKAGLFDRADDETNGLTGKVGKEEEGEDEKARPTERTALLCG